MGETIEDGGNDTFFCG